MEYLQYESGTHASSKCTIPESIVLSCSSDASIQINIRRIVVSGSFQRVIGVSLTRKCKIDHINRDVLELHIFNHEETRDIISLSAHGEQFYINSDLFFHRNFYYITALRTISSAFVQVFSERMTCLGPVEKLSSMRLTNICVVNPTFTTTRLSSNETKFEMMSLRHILH